MQKKWLVLILMNVIASWIMLPSVAAEEIKMAGYNTASQFIQTDNQSPNKFNSQVSRLNWIRSSYPYKPSQGSPKIDFSRYLPLPLEVDASSPPLFDPEVRLGLDPKWKDETLSCTLGIKYSFSRFELQEFAKSLLSLFTDTKKDKPRKESKHSVPVSFYLSVPEY